MADEADSANEMLERAMEAFRKGRRITSPLIGTGKCRNCGESCEGRNFCDVDCRDEYQKRERLRGKSA